MEKLQVTVYVISKREVRRVASKDNSQKAPLLTFLRHAKVCLALPMTRTQETWAETKAKLVVGSTIPARNGIV